MFAATTLQKQFDRVRDDRLRVLVVGAGVAGLTLAQRLRAEGLHPVLVERAENHDEAGYMLALMPFVQAAIRGIGVERAYHDASIQLRRYRLHGHTGELLREYSMGAMLDDYGDYRGIARGALMQVLAAGGAAVSYGATVGAIAQTPAAVRATLVQDGQGIEGEFDVVALADGLHSDSRALVLEPGQVATYDTDWGGWVVWADSDAASQDVGDEIWGADFFIGIYPVKGLDGVFLGGHCDDTRAGPEAFVARVRRSLRTIAPRIERALAAVANQGDPYFWRLVDCRCSDWTAGRVVLLGDAAAGFLPTAGIGAAMAMESAEQLARGLLTATRDDIAGVLRAYERTQRPRVESAQDNSRMLAKLMFRRSRVLAMVRDLACRVLTMKMALGPIRKLLDSSPVRR